MALAQHFIANNGFNSVKIPLPTNTLADTTLLEREAFPGELASLRAQLSQSPVTLQNKSDQKNSLIVGVNFLSTKKSTLKLH